MIKYTMDKKKIAVGSYVFYKKLQSFAKILEIDIVSHSYTIDCNGRIIDTNDDFLDFNIGIRAKEIELERDEWKRRAESLEENLEILNNELKRTEHLLKRRL
jgi:hypothetical protein